MSDKSTIQIKGGNKLSGSIRIQGSKNSFHKVLGVIVRWPGVYRILDIPAIQDAQWLLDQFEYVGGIVSRDGLVTILDSRHVEPKSIDHDHAEKSSGTFLFAGAMLARFGRVEIAAPGGDKIGFRPVGYHLSAFKELGAEVNENGSIHSIASDKLSGTEFTMEGRTVNGTVNAVLAATGAEGESTIHNCVLESDIEDSFEFMRQLGIEVTIVDREKGSVRVIPGPAKAELEYQLIADRNATATYAVIASLLGDPLTLENVNIVDTSPLWDFLREVGADVQVDTQTKTTIITNARLRPHPEVVEGYIPPQFSTDYMPMIQVLLTQVPGKTEYHENVFSNRFAHVPELAKMGAVTSLHDIDKDKWIDGSDYGASLNLDRCRYEGPVELHGAKVAANDIRNAAALVIAGLIAKGETVVHEAIHAKRGYEDIVQNLTKLGAEIYWE